MLVLATLIAFATPFGTFIARGFETATTGFSFTAGTAVSDTIGDLNPTPLSELQERHKFEYYSSLALAVDDINAGTIGKSADKNKDNAVTGIYVYKGMPHVVLLKDNREDRRVVPATDMNINLGGNTLTSSDWPILWCEKGNIIIDGRLDGSTIYSDVLPQGRVLQVQKDATVELKEGTYTLAKGETEEKLASVAIMVRGTLKANNVNINAFANSTIIGISTKGDFGNIVLENSAINVISYNKSSYIGTNTSSMTFSNCDINVNSQNGYAYGIKVRKYEDAVAGTIVTNIYNSKLNIYTGNDYVRGISITDEVTNDTIINIQNSNITVTSENNSAYGIGSLSSHPVHINIIKSDIIAISNASSKISYGISGFENCNVTIDRSTVLANKHLQGTDIKNSVGISIGGELKSKYSTIFGTKENISTP